MSEISRVNLQIGLHNEKVQDVCGNFMEHRKKRRGSGEPIQCAMVRHSSIAIILTYVICMPVLLAKFLRDSYYELS